MYSDNKLLKALESIPEDIYPPEKIENFFDKFSPEIKTLVKDLHSEDRDMILKLINILVREFIWLNECCIATTRHGNYMRKDKSHSRYLKTIEGKMDSLRDMTERLPSEAIAEKINELEQMIGDSVESITDLSPWEKPKKAKHLEPALKEIIQRFGIETNDNQIAILLKKIPTSS